MFQKKGFLLLFFIYALFQTSLGQTDSTIFANFFYGIHCNGIYFQSNDSINGKCICSTNYYVLKRDLKDSLLFNFKMFSVSNQLQEKGQFKAMEPRIAKIYNSDAFFNSDTTSISDLKPDCIIKFYDLEKIGKWYYYKNNKVAKRKKHHPIYNYTERNKIRTEELKKKCGTR